MPDIALIDNPEDDTQTALLQPRNFGRDEFQQKRDAELLEKVNEWRAKGSPQPVHDQATNTLQPNPEAPFLRYTVDKANLADIKRAVRRAAQLHKVGLSWYPDRKNESGTVTIKFSPTVLPPKADKTAENGQAEGQPEGQPEGQTEGQPEGEQEPQGRGRR